MAGEEFFIASALASAAIICALLYLHSRTKEPLWQAAWLFGVFLVMDYTLSLSRYSIITIEGITPLDDLTFGILNITNWLVVLVTFYLGYLLLLELIKVFMSVFDGYGKFDETGREG